MYDIIKTERFRKWLDSFKDPVTQLRLIRRLDKAQRGLFGDYKFIKDGIYEMRENYGAGYRMYYVIRNNTIIVMLGGGDKSSQQKDIEDAIRLSKEIDFYR